MPIDAIIFDVEGTLINCVGHVLDSWHKTLAEGGHTVLRADLQRFSGMDGHDMLDRLLPGVPTTEKEVLLKAQGERYRRSYLHLGRPFAGVRDLITGLKKDGYRLAIATTCKADELKAYDAHMGILDSIDAVACGSDASHGKPHSDLFRLALRKLPGLEPRKAMAVGDTPYDALAAKPLSISVTGLLTGGFDEHELRTAGCDVILPDVGSLHEVLQSRGR
jgi:phosphoglycolate phosphatase-like HAD superfamily hydrolase